MLDITCEWINPMFDLRKLVKQVKYNEIKAINFNNEIIPDYSKNPQQSTISLDCECFSDSTLTWGYLIGLPNNIVACNIDDKIYICDTNIKKCINVLKNNEYVSHLLALPDGRFISVHNGTSVKIWSLDDNKYVCETLFNQTVWINCLTVLSNNLVVTCSNDNFIRVWDINRKKHIFHIFNKSDSLIRKVVSTSNYNIVTVDKENNISYWNIDELFKRVSGKFNCDIYELVLDDYDNIYFGDEQGRIIEAKPFDGYINECFKITDKPIFAIKVLPDCNLIVYSSSGDICILNQMKNNITQSLEIDKSAYAIEILSDGRIAVACKNGMILLLEFPMRLIRTTDIFPLINALEKNTSVKQLNIRDIQQDDINDDYSIIRYLELSRSDMNIVNKLK